MSGILKLSDENFEKEILKSDFLCLVDFFSDFCGPCKLLSPIIEELAEEYKDKIKIGKLDVSENIITVSKYKVMSIPNILFFKNGKIVDQIIGAVPKEEIKKRIEALL